MKLMRYVGDSEVLHGREFYVQDRPTRLGGVRARYKYSSEPDAWYDFDVTDFEEIEQENI